MRDCDGDVLQRVEVIEEDTAIARKFPLKERGEKYLSRYFLSDAISHQYFPLAKISYQGHLSNIIYGRRTWNKSGAKGNAQHITY